MIIVLAPTRDCHRYFRYNCAREFPSTVLSLSLPISHPPLFLQPRNEKGRQESRGENTTIIANLQFCIVDAHYAARKDYAHSDIEFELQLIQLIRGTKWKFAKQIREFVLHIIISSDNWILCWNYSSVKITDTDKNFIHVFLMQLTEIIEKSIRKRILHSNYN